MFASIVYLLTSVPLLLFTPEICKADLPPSPPWLVLYSPGEPEYPDVLVKRVGDNLTLSCELRGDAVASVFVWNYIASNDSDGDSKPYTVEPLSGATLSSTLHRQQLSVADSGHYMCSAPPFSVTKYILVQERGPKQCARGSFWCGNRCVLAVYVCDGRKDCLHGEDEAPPACYQPCARSDKLNCSSGRCLSESACCRTSSPTCQQPACCDEHARYSRLQGYDVEFPPLFEDRHAPDDYGFIQSTIYTVTACALIFMIAVVLLVSAICKMHMKRAALRSYAHADRATSAHYNMHYAQTHRFPPCYEASRLLEDARQNPPTLTNSSPICSPTTPTSQQCNTECPAESVCPDSPGSGREECRNTGFGLARLSSMFTSRYRQVPTTSEVEMTDVRSTSLNNSPTRQRTRLDNYRSPTYCDLNTEFFFNPDTSNCGRDLNYMATPIDFFRRRAMRRNTLERVIDQLNDRQRPLTLQLGRFQLSIPRFGRRPSTERRPDTPNVAEISIDDLDFVRLNSNETYTLNGRTIRLLGANFENYPVLPDGTRPPPYNEAMRYKLYGPPPEYLSRDGLNENSPTTVDEEARNNVEMPPCYDELASGVDSNANISENCVSLTSNGNITGNANIVTGNNGNITNLTLTNSQITGNIATNNNVSNNNELPVTGNGITGNVVESINSVIDNLPAIDSDVNANDTIETRNVINGN